MNDQNTNRVSMSSTFEGMLKKPVSRRVLMRAGMASALAGGLVALTGCGSTSDTATADAETGEKLRIGMEAAYAPYNWQTTTETEYTIPIDNVSGAYADGYDVQIGKLVAEALGKEPVAVKQSWSGLIDALNSGQIDCIIAGMSATPERAQSIDFSDPYFVGSFGLFVLEGSQYENATSLADFEGASVLGQKDTMLDTVIDEIPGVNHLTPVDTVPNVLARLAQGTCDAVTYNVENEAGYMRSTPGIVPVQFAEGEGFQEEVTANVGICKGQDELLAQINEVIDNLGDAERQEIWDAVLERQPA
jgi:ABC-type amino acid transport substrate-binding protein